jgi:hypothetical protein
LPKNRFGAIPQLPESFNVKYLLTLNRAIIKQPTKMKNEQLILNATVQLGVAVVLGWLLGLFHALNTTQVLIFKSQLK